MSKNKYAHLFHPPMTSAEARLVLFTTVTADMSDEDKKALAEACSDYFVPTFEKEQQEMRENGILFA